MPITRRSARLRGKTPVVEVEKQPLHAATKLQSLAEKDDEVATPNIKTRTNAHPMTPLKSTLSTPAKHRSSSKASVKTPNTTASLKPGLEEMHPSKVQQSTSKQPDTGLVLGFQPVQMDPNAPGKPLLTLSNTPSKGRLSHPDQLEALSSDFKFSGENSELSAEAREIMRNIREDTARIKAELIMKENEQRHKDSEAKQMGTRKIAKAKGKIGRFSEIHMAQFKKMDSIADHPSSFRARPERVHASISKGLKRTISKARLDEPEKPSPATAKTVTRTAASTDSTTKRLKKNENEDASTRRPLSKDDQAANRPGLRTEANIPDNLNTPYKPAAVRCTSVKHFQTTKIPSLSHPPSKEELAPRTPHTDFKPKFKSTAPGLGTLKSILRRRQPLFSNDPIKIAAGTHQAFPNNDLASKLLFASDTSNASPILPSAKKHVDFSDSIKLPDSSNESSDSPQTPDANITAKCTDNGDIMYPTLPSLSTLRDSKQGNFPFEPSPSDARKTPVTTRTRRQLNFSTPGAIPHGITNKKRHREDDENDDMESKVPPDPTNCQRSVKRAKILPASLSQIQTPSPVKQRPVTHGTPRSIVRGGKMNSVERRTGLSLSRLSFLARPKQRR
ncbi:hypothetical protein PRK78_000721 [Emydomyces testavorans]|uniref:Erythromycin esterase n=1 Tax=Emydomyces testavorans TaxID=2070801 RepID=A0AAF0DB72_9EURO|nr:hypothetical protein PRK78_000721 [Emydomyces testavorans]